MTWVDEYKERTWVHEFKPHDGEWRDHSTEEWVNTTWFGQITWLLDVWPIDRHA